MQKKLFKNLVFMAMELKLNPVKYEPY